MRTALVLLTLTCTGCGAIGDLEDAAAARAKRPIIVTIYHAKF